MFRQGSVKHQTELVTTVPCCLVNAGFVMQTNVLQAEATATSSADPQRWTSILVKLTRETSKEEGQVTILLRITKIKTTKFLGALDVEGDISRPTQRAQCRKRR